MFSRYRRGFSILICLFIYNMPLCRLELISLTCIVNCIVNSVVLSVSIHDLVHFLKKLFGLYVFFLFKILLVVNLVGGVVSHKNTMLSKMFILLCCVYYVLLFFYIVFVYTLFFIYYEFEAFEGVKIIIFKLDCYTYIFNYYCVYGCDNYCILFYVV